MDPLQFIKGMIILIGLLLVGDILSDIFSIPVPGSVIGMVLLFVCLVTSNTLSDDLEKTADGLIGHIGLLFVPAGAGISLYLTMIVENWQVILLASFVSTALTLISTALLFKALSKKER